MLSKRKACSEHAHYISTFSNNQPAYSQLRYIHNFDIVFHEELCENSLPRYQGSRKRSVIHRTHSARRAPGLQYHKLRAGFHYLLQRKLRASSEFNSAPVIIWLRQLYHRGYPSRELSFLAGRFIRSKMKMAIAFTPRLIG